MVVAYTEKLDYSRSVIAGKVNFGGGGTTLVVEIPGLKPESFPIAQIESTSAMIPPYVISSVITADTLTVTFSGDPATSVINYIIALDQA